MASKPPKSTVKTLPLEAPAKGSIYAADGFEHKGVSYSEGVHNELDGVLVREIVEAGKAEACERPADRSQPEQNAGGDNEQK